MRTSTGQLNAAELRALRMRALGLWQTLPGAGASDEAISGADRVTAVTRGLLALQGQDWNAARWALGVRAPGVTDRDVFDAFDSGALVRSWPMRGTIHVLEARDIGWMQAALGARVLAGAPKRREFIGLDDATLTRMTDIAVERLSGGRSLSRDELGAAWVEAGIGHPEKGVGPWRYHVVWWLCQNGITVPGPVSTAAGTDEVSAGEAGEPRLVLADEWITDPRRLEGDEALIELATRFARGRGPVQERDLAWWTGLGVRDARKSIAGAVADGRLVGVESGGVAYWADPELLDTAADAASAVDTLLLPGFDEHLLGYTDRTAVLDPEHFERIVPGRNGMFRATVVQGGRTVGVWTRTARAKSTRISVEPFPGETLDLAGVRAAADTWGAFRGVNVEVEVSD